LLVRLVVLGYDVRNSVKWLYSNCFVLTGPTPDWIVGVSGLNLCNKDCTWTEQKIIDLYPWDAGTDSGITYMVIT
jgi:hypothetical protein